MFTISVSPKLAGIYLAYTHEATAHTHTYTQSN